MIHEYDIRVLLKSTEKLIYWTMEVAVWVYHNIQDYCDFKKMKHWWHDNTVIGKKKKRGKNVQ